MGPPQVISPYAPLPEPSPQAGTKLRGGKLGMLENRGTSFSGFNEGSPDSIAGWFIMEIPI
jgi:hypothetical protein